MEAMRMRDGYIETHLLTKEGIFDKVMQGQHLTSEEKAFVLNGYRPVGAVPARTGEAVNRDGAGPAFSAAVACVRSSEGVVCRASRGPRWPR